MESQFENQQSTLFKIEDIILAQLELVRQVQSLVDTSAHSLDAFRSHCSTSRELIKDEIRMLEGKLIQRVGRQLAIRKAITKLLSQIKTSLHMPLYPETNLDELVRQQTDLDNTDGSAFVLESNGPADIVKRLETVLAVDFAEYPSLDRWLDIVGLQQPCIQAVMTLVADVDELLVCSESKLKNAIVQATIDLPLATTPIPSKAPSVVDSAVEESSKEVGALRDPTYKDKGKIPYHIREDLRRLITSTRLMRTYTERILNSDADLKELSDFELLKKSAHMNSYTSPSNTSPPVLGGNSLSRKESVRSMYWDSWRLRPLLGSPAPDQGTTSESSSTFPAVHLPARDQGLYPVPSSFSSEENKHRGAVPSGPRGSGGTERLTSQSSVISSVSNATTTGDEGENGSTYADLPSASSSCVNSVFPSSNNLSQIVQPFDASPGTIRRLQMGSRDAAAFALLTAEAVGNIRPSSSTPSLLLVGRSAAVTAMPLPVPKPSALQKKEMLKFTKSTSLESSLKTQNSIDEPGSIPQIRMDPENLANPPTSASSSSVGRMHHSIHHVFKSHIFLAATRCTYCDRTLRGIGRKCRHCKFRSHPDCAEKSPPCCGLPDRLVQEYMRRGTPKLLNSNGDQENMDSEVQVEDDDETLQPYSNDSRRRISAQTDVYPEKGRERLSSVVSPKTPDISPPKSPWKKTLTFFGAKMTLHPEPKPRPKLSKQRSQSTGNVLAGIKDNQAMATHQVPVPSSQVRSPISRRFSGSFSLPRDQRRRRQKIEPKTGAEATHVVRKPVPPRETRILSDPNIEVRVDKKSRTASGSSETRDPQSPAFTSMDSLSTHGSSHSGSAGGASVPPSPGTFSRSGSSGPPMSPLATSSFAQPAGRAYRSFIRNVKDQFRSHFPWPLARDEAASRLVPDSPALPKLPLSRRSSREPGQLLQTPQRENAEEEAEAMDNFPAVAPRMFPTVLVTPSQQIDAKQVVGRRYSLLEPQEDIEPVSAIAPPHKPPITVMESNSSADVEEEENEASYSSENADHVGEPVILRRRQQSLYLRELSIPYKELVFGEKLGQGSFGQVFKGKWHGDVAIKVLNTDYLYNDVEELHEAFKVELSTLRKTRHDNLVLFMGACTRSEDDKHQQIIVTSLLSRGVSAAGVAQSITLYDLIHENKGAKSVRPYQAQLNRLLIIASQICQGMGYLHRRGIIHRDLKSQNVFVTHERCIITDYGLFSVSKMFRHGRPDDQLSFPRNWLSYLAPEICRHLKTPKQMKKEYVAHRASGSTEKYDAVPFNIFSDIYAFGTILFELCTGAFPALYSTHNSIKLARQAAAGLASVATPAGVDTPITPQGPSTPAAPYYPGPGRGSKQVDPSLPDSLEAALYMISSGTHPLYRIFRPRGAKKASTPQGAPPTPPTPFARSPHTLLAPSLDETASKELADIISICWSHRMAARKEFPEIFTHLDRVPKKSLARSPSHPVHGNASHSKEHIQY